ncbi:MAG TPA: BtpA/SgcQ family protein, partial [Bacillota bacterium]|nr:BtpA/SgcQ family protein [Bacillota bacterium]
VIVSGKHTGFPTRMDDVRAVKRVLPEVPVLIGSGLRQSSAAEFLEVADGAIVGSSLKQDGDAANPVDCERVRSLMEVVRRVRETREAERA